MKLILFVTGLLSFVFYRAAKTEVKLLGTWDGAYTCLQKKVDVKLVFGKNNCVELYSNELKTNGKTCGIYKISNSNEIEISTKSPAEANSSFTMNGRLNAENNFVDGNWKSDDHSNGSFYLAKEVLK